MVISDVAAIVSAVSYVAIDKQIGLPFVPEFNPRTRFGRVGLHVVAIQILICTGRAPTHFDWAILVDPIVRTGSFVAIGVVNRNEEQDDVCQQSFESLGDSEVAKQSETGVFAIRFTGVNTSLNQDDRFSLSVGGSRRERAGFRSDD